MKKRYFTNNRFWAWMRFRKKPKGIFGEIGYRGLCCKTYTYLYTTPQRLITEKRINYQYWLFKEFPPTMRIYVGISYSF